MSETSRRNQKYNFVIKSGYKKRRDYNEATYLSKEWMVSRSACSVRYTCMEVVKKFREKKGDEHNVHRIKKIKKTLKTGAALKNLKAKAATNKAEGVGAAGKKGGTAKAKAKAKPGINSNFRIRKSMKKT